MPKGFFFEMSDNRTIFSLAPLQPIGSHA